MVFNATFNNISVKEGILKINLKFKKPIKIELKKKKNLNWVLVLFGPVVSQKRY